MPYAIKVGAKFLKRANQGSPGYGIGRSRWLVDTVEEATTWTLIGHAKAAWIAAVENKQFPQSTKIEVVKVAYQVVESWGPLMAIRQYRTVGSKRYASGLKVGPVPRKKTSAA